MTCSRGRAAPDDYTKLRLFADSGGFCQNPTCLRTLFVDIGNEHLHIGEMAHICAASDGGPRSQTSMSEAERGAYENLALLCPSCHTIIDKAPKVYPDTLIQGWKAKHKERIAAAFGAIKHTDRKLVRDSIEPLLEQNRAIFETYGPDQDYRFNPESDLAAVWRRKMLSHILPNNRKILAILDANRTHLTADEQRILELFRQHVDDLEARHIGTGIGAVGARFPEGMNTLLGGLSK